MLGDRRSQSSLCCLDLLDQLRHDLEQVAHDAVVSNTEDGSTLVLVDSDDALRILHTGGVLDGTGNAQSHIDLGVHGLTGLTDLMVSGHPACIGDGTGSTHNAAAQSGCQLLGQLDALVDILAIAKTTSESVGGDGTVKKQPRKVKKIGRNEPCPCGSGKKYKNCCGRDA